MYDMYMYHDVTDGLCKIFKEIRFSARGSNSREKVGGNLHDLEEWETGGLHGVTPICPQCKITAIYLCIR